LSTNYQLHSYRYISKYLPKLYHFDYEHITVGNMLAALENNHNTGRKQKVTQRKVAASKTVLKSHYRIAYRKPKKKFIARKYYEPKSYNYFFNMKANVQQNVINNKRCLKPSTRKRMAPNEREERGTMIRKSLKYSRFK